MVLLITLIEELINSVIFILKVQKSLIGESFHSPPNMLDPHPLLYLSNVTETLYTE